MAVQRVLGSGIFQACLSEAHQSNSTGPRRRRRPKTSPMRRTSTSFRSKTNARRRYGTKRATGLTCIRVRGTTAAADTSHMFSVSSRRSVSSFTLFCCSCGLSFGFSSGFSGGFALGFPGGFAFGFPGGFACGFVCGLSGTRSRSSERRCRGCLFLARDPDVAVWARPIFGNRCRSDPAT